VERGGTTEDLLRNPRRNQRNLTFNVGQCGCLDQIIEI
jgi:hypothetical protein